MDLQGMIDMSDEDIFPVVDGAHDAYMHPIPDLAGDCVLPVIDADHEVPFTPEVIDLPILFQSIN